MKQKIYLTAFSAFAALAIASSAYAVKSAENDALAIANAKIGMTQAVNTAEQNVGGKAARADFERHQGHWVFDIEVVKANRVMDVTVDATNGQVISVAEDKFDHDDGNGKAD